MSANDIPEWAVLRAISLANEAAPRQMWGVANVGNGAIQALARYIAAHEEAPVDPVEAAKIELITRWFDDDGYFSTDAIRDAVDRGIELAKAGAA